MDVIVFWVFLQQVEKLVGVRVFFYSGWVSWWMSDTIDLDAVPDAWLSAGEDVLSAAGSGIDVGLAEDLAAGLTMGWGGGGGEEDVKKQD